MLSVQQLQQLAAVPLPHLGLQVTFITCYFLDQARSVSNRGNQPAPGACVRKLILMATWLTVACDVADLCRVTQVDTATLRSIVTVQACVAATCPSVPAGQACVAGGGSFVVLRTISDLLAMLDDPLLIKPAPPHPKHLHVCCRQM